MAPIIEGRAFESVNFSFRVHRFYGHKIQSIAIAKILPCFFDVSGYVLSQIKHSSRVTGLLELFGGRTDSYSYCLRLTRISPLSVVGQVINYNGLAGLKHELNSLSPKPEDCQRLFMAIHVRIPSAPSHQIGSK